jgi:cytochrome c biogenesis protein CcmG/thiol:disulfide interchange protein DsbE
MKKTAPLILLTLIAFMGLMLMVHRHSGMGGKLAEATGAPAPAITLPILDAPGQTFDPAARKGTAYTVNFFASWCPDCRAEHENLLALAKKNILIVGIAYQDKPAPIREFLGKKGSPYSAVAFDDKGNAFAAWGLSGVPESFIIDKAGIIRFHYMGPMSESVIERDFLPAWRKAVQ